MKTIIQVLFCSLFIHIIIFLYMFGWPFLKSKLDNIDILGNGGDRYVAATDIDVMFGFVGSPVVFLGTSFLGIAIVCGFIIKVIKKS